MAEARCAGGGTGSPNTRMGSDPYGNLTSVTDANGHISTTVYEDVAHLYPKDEINPLGDTTNTAINYKWGRPD